MAGKRLENRVAKFNRDWPAGTEVRYWPGVKEGPGRRGTIRSEWWALGHGQIVVKVTDYPGGIAAEHVEPLTSFELEAEREAKKAAGPAPAEKGGE